MSRGKAICWPGGAESVWVCRCGLTAAGVSMRLPKKNPQEIPAMLKFNVRTVLAVLHDAIAAALAWIFAYLLRFNFELPGEFAAEMWNTLVWVIPLQVVIFWRFNLYRGIWRYASTTDLRRIFLAVMLSAAAIPLLFLMLRQDWVIPRSVLVINPLLLILMMGGSRFVYRLWKEQGL